MYVKLTCIAVVVLLSVWESKCRGGNSQFDNCAIENDEFCPTTCKIEEKIKNLEERVVREASQQRDSLIKTTLIINQLLHDVNENAFPRNLQHEIDLLIWNQQQAYNKYMDLVDKVSHKKLGIMVLEEQIMEQDKILKELKAQIEVTKKDCDFDDMEQGIDDAPFEFQESRRRSETVIQIPDDIEHILRRDENDAERNTPKVICEFVEAPSLVNCYELYRKGYKVNGIYNIRPSALYPDFPVYCDMENGGWMVLQRRKDGSVDFDRTWKDYKNGFGGIENFCKGEFWLGNEYLSILGLNRFYTIRFKLTDTNDVIHVAEYSYFRVLMEIRKYTIQISAFDKHHSNATDTMTQRRNEYNKFTTKDSDDRNGCLRRQSGGWWFEHECDNANLNGRYASDGTSPGSSGMHWEPNVVLKACEIMIHPI